MVRGKFRRGQYVIVKLYHFRDLGYRENTNVVDLSKNGCFNGGTIVENELIWLRYIRRGGMIGENHQKIIGSK